jgi:hypothetical protein
VLIALAQSADPSHPVALVGIEEPESAVHPAATGVLLDSLLDAAHRTQVMVTSHSPDLLDSGEVHEDQIVAVSAARGVSVLGPVSEVGRSALREHLYSAGELLRMSQLEPDESKHAIQPDQLDLFEGFSS